MEQRNLIPMKIVDLSLATILQKARVQSSYSFIAFIVPFVLKWTETLEPLTNSFWSLRMDKRGSAVLPQVINLIAR